MKWLGTELGRTDLHFLLTKNNLPTAFAYKKISSNCADRNARKMF
jgi:hypothetical protein